jgi:hypothetical protein
MSDDPAEARAAGQAVQAELAAGQPVFEGRAMSGREQREAGLPVPSQRSAPSTRQAPAADASALAQAQRRKDIADEKYSAAFDEQRAAADELERLEVQGYSDEWSSDDDIDLTPIEPMPESEVAEAQAAYDAREAAVFEPSNPLAAAAWEQMQ